MSRSTAYRAFEVGLWLTAFVCLAWVLTAWVQAWQTEQRIDRALAESPKTVPRAEDLGGTDLVVPVLAAGDAIGRLRIPDVDVEAAVLEGEQENVLGRAVGHLSDTDLPGAGGTVALAGHRDSFFRNLRHVEAGQWIELETPWGRFHYKVDETLVVGPEELWVLDDPPSGEALTLITCHPFDWVGPAPDRFVVRATRSLAVDSELPEDTLRTTQEIDADGRAAH